MAMLYMSRPLSLFITTHRGWPIGLVVRHPFPVREIVGSNPALVVNFLLFFYRNTFLRLFSYCSYG